MKILGIETSCDETAASVVEDGVDVLSSVVASSAEMHKKTGGIIPEKAAREQIKSIIPVVKTALNEAFDNKNLSTPPIDAIAVTVGPGLIGSLLVGVETAKTLSLTWNLPIIPVNHLKAHIYANWLETNSLPEFPALCLVVSGGHTELVLMKSHKNFLWIGGTRDDAAGEAFDKTARILSLPYPGGPEISQKAEIYIKKYPNKKLKLFPRPMINKDNFEWSFSGLKTAVLNEVSGKDEIDKQMYSAEIQEAIVEVLVTKSIKAIKKYEPASFVLSGGVAANKRLRENISKKVVEQKTKVELCIPPLKYCTDNAACIASRAFFSKVTHDWKEISANPQLNLKDNANS